MGKALRRLKGALARLQTGWSILGITLVVLLLVEGGCRLIFAVRDRLTAVPVPDPRVIAEGYGGAAWPVVHYRELEQLQERWQPYVYFRQKPFRGETITIDNDGRAHHLAIVQRGRSDRGERGSVKILTLGGSSLWGFGAPTTRRFPRYWLVRSMKKGGVSSSRIWRRSAM